MTGVLRAATVALLLACLPAAMRQADAGAPQAKGAASPDPSQWTIDTLNSGAGFAARHMLVSTVRGHLGPVTGTIWYDGVNVSSIRAEATIDVRKISSGNEDRDTHLRTDDFFDVPHHPTMTFTSKRVVPGAPGHFTMIGDLTIRGTTKEVTLEVEGPQPIFKAKGLSRTAATATTTINRFDYGLKWNNLIDAGGGAMVGPNIAVTIDLEAIQR